MSPIRYDVDKTCISCVAQTGYVVAQVAGHVQVTPLSGLCFAGVLINFRSGKFQALDMSFFSKGHAGFFGFCRQVIIF